MGGAGEGWGVKEVEEGGTRGRRDGEGRGEGVRGRRREEGAGGLGMRLDSTSCHFSSCSGWSCGCESGAEKGEKGGVERDGEEREEGEGRGGSGEEEGEAVVEGEDEGEEGQGWGSGTHSQPRTVSTAGLPVVKARQWRGAPVSESLQQRQRGSG